MPYSSLFKQLVAVPALGVILSACGGGDDDGGGSTGGGNPTPTASPEPMETPSGLAGMPPIYQPEDNKVLMFVGQDNASVGGNSTYNNGYVDDEELGVPAGITTYIGFAFPCDPALTAVNTPEDWGAGPMHLKAYLDSETLEGSIIHLSIDMAFNDSEIPTANGDKDSCIQQVASFIDDYPDTMFFVRIGYEFDASHNHYDATAWKGAFRRVVDTFLEMGVENFNTVMTSTQAISSAASWDRYWPGDEYVHWMGYSYFGGNITNTAPTLEYARDKGKPIFIAEATPRGQQLDTISDTASTTLWNGYFTDLLDQAENNGDVVKAISYINADWDSQRQWANDNWGDTRIQTNTVIKQNWIEKMGESRYIHSATEANSSIGF